VAVAVCSAVVNNGLVKKLLTHLTVVLSLVEVFILDHYEPHQVLGEYNSLTTAQMVQSGCHKTVFKLLNKYCKILNFGCP